MKILKRVVSLVMLCAMLLCWSNDVSAMPISKEGFTYDDSYYSVVWRNIQRHNVYTEAGGLLGTAEYRVGVAKLKGYDNDYTVMIRLTMTPNSTAVKRTLDSNRKAYGLSEYISVKTYVSGHLGKYQPENNPNTDSLELSFGVSKEGPSLGASYTITNSDLDITAKCNSNTELFYMVYDYKPSVINIFADNTYVAEESNQYCMAQFETTAERHTFALQIDARFGASSDNDSSPLRIWKNYVRKQVKNVNFWFNLK